MHEFVSAVCDEVEKLRRAGDGKEECASPDNQDLKKCNADGEGCCVAEELWVEGATKTGEEC